MAGLDPEVHDWEPREALVDRGQTLAVLEGARAVLADGGRLVLESHEQRARELARTLTGAGYRNLRITEDLAGRERVVEAQWQR